MEHRTHYEVCRNSRNALCIRAVDVTGRIVNEAENLPENPAYVNNLVTLYNANHLMPEHFSMLTEQLIGILL